MFLAIWGRRFSQKAKQALKTEKEGQDTQTFLMQARVLGPARSQESLGQLETGRHSGAPRELCQCQSLAMSDAGLLEMPSLSDRPGRAKGWPRPGQGWLSDVTTCLQLKLIHFQEVTCCWSLSAACAEPLPIHI